jgi:hypothetical protein
MIEQLPFTGKTHNTNGRAGGARSSDGRLDLKLLEPHPVAEQLFGAAWSSENELEMERRLSISRIFPVNHGSSGWSWLRP